MKSFKKVGCSVLALSFALSGTMLTACGGGGEQVVKDGKTLNVRLFKGGYGEEFMLELEEKFEEVFAEEGYKLNVLTPSQDMRGTPALQEMAQGYAETNIDLYITADIKVTQVGVDGDYGVVAADLEELVYDKKPIGYDGVEEDVTVGDKTSKFVKEFITDEDGTVYGFNWSQSTAGLVVNTRKLAKYGINDIPRTTDEMFEIYEKIYLGTNGIENSEKSKTFPVTHFGYAEKAVWSWMAQYDMEEYNRFMSMQERDGEMVTDMLDDGYEIFNTEAFEKTLALAYQAFDKRISAYGTETQTLDQSQAKIMKDGNNDAVFMFNGDWMLNEVKLNYRNALNDIRFINTPVNSELGRKLFAVAPYNLNETQADDLLSLICQKVDERKSIDEMIAAAQSEMGVTLAKADAETVAKARGLVFARGIEHIAYVTKDSSKKDIAALLLRMMASDDFATTFSKYANTATPYANLEVLENDKQFVKDAFEIVTNPYATMFCDNMTGIRKKLVVTSLPNGQRVLATVLGQTVSMYDGKGNKVGTTQVYKDAAKELRTSSYNMAKDNWQTWLKNHGLK